MNQLRTHTPDVAVLRTETAGRRQESARRKHLIAGQTAVLLAVTGCSATPPAPAGATTNPDTSTSARRRRPSRRHPPTIATPDATSPAIPPTSTPGPSSVPTSATPDPHSRADATDSTIVRFTSGAVSVDVTITADNATTRDFLAMLPLTLTLEEFNGREKISYLPRELETSGSPGSDPEDGDLIYFVPWGNLGFYYNTDGIGYSDQVIHLGIYDAFIEQLTALEGGDVTVEIVE